MLLFVFECVGVFGKLVFVVLLLGLEEILVWVFMVLPQYLTLHCEV